MASVITGARITRRSKFVLCFKRSLADHVSFFRCHARIKLDRYNESAFLMRGHNHNPEAEIDPDCERIYSHCL